MTLTLPLTNRYVGRHETSVTLTLPHNIIHIWADKNLSHNFDTSPTQQVCIGDVSSSCAGPSDRQGVEGEGRGVG